VYKIIKSSLDVFFALIAFPFVFILFLFIAIAIKIEDGGPVFYSTDRIGMNGIIFRMFKFRSMKINAEDIRLTDGSTYNSPDDQRVTKIGKFIRKTSIDELPQIFNIIRGDMTFIGPRPDSAFWLSNYTDEERIILSVRPGVTGYNQAINRNSVGTKAKIQNDIIYVNNISFWFDFKIILLTIKSVFLLKDVYRS